MKPYWLVTAFLVAIFSGGCGSDDGDEGEGESGVLMYGRLVSAVLGDPLAGEVTVGDEIINTNEGGYFTLTDLSAGEVLVQASAENHAQATKPVTLPESGSTFVQISMLEFEANTMFDAAAGGTVSTGDGASVTFGPGALAGSGNVTAYLASLSASMPNEVAAFPGAFRTVDGDQLETFGAIAVEVRDDSGNLVELADGQSADATIPAPAGSPDTMPLWSFDHATGLWDDDGGMLTGCMGGSCVGSLPHLSWWNADLVLETTCITVCVSDSEGEPSAGVEVYAQGVDYTGLSSGWTGDDGCACLNVKSSATVDLYAVGSGGIAGPIQATTADDNALCGEDECPLAAELEIAAPKFQAILSWSEQPSDLDSHFTGPCAPDDTACVDRFHIAYTFTGNLAGPPWAFLDTDDTSSFGPEIVTLVQCTAGVYRYSVHNFSGTPGIETSVAVVVLLLPDGSVRTEEVPTSNPDAGLVWIVGDLTCDSSQDCTWESINTFGPEDDSSYHP